MPLRRLQLGDAVPTAGRLDRDGGETVGAIFCGRSCCWDSAHPVDLTDHQEDDKGDNEEGYHEVYEEPVVDGDGTASLGLSKDLVCRLLLEKKKEEKTG